MSICCIENVKNFILTQIVPSKVLGQPPEGNLSRVLSSTKRINPPLRGHSGAPRPLPPFQDVRRAVGMICPWRFLARGEIPCRLLLSISGGGPKRHVPERAIKNGGTWPGPDLNDEGIPSVLAWNAAVPEASGFDMSLLEKAGAGE